MTPDLPSSMEPGPVPVSSSFVKAFAAAAAACVCALRSRGLLSETQAAARLSVCEGFYLKGRPAAVPARPLEGWADDFLAALADGDGLLRAVYPSRRILAAAGDLAALVDLETLDSVLRGALFAARRCGDSAEEVRLLRLRNRIGDLAVRLGALPLDEDAVSPLASIVGLPLRPETGNFDAEAFESLHAEIARTALAEGYSPVPAERGIGEAIAGSLSAVGRLSDLLSGGSRGERGVRAWR